MDAVGEADTIAGVKSEGWPLGSQNHRMVEVGRDLCGSPSSTPC